MQRMYRCMLGGPFFTTVPSGRVGRNRDSAYFSNEAFVQGTRRSERDDQVNIVTPLVSSTPTFCVCKLRINPLKAAPTNKLLGFYVWCFFSGSSERLKSVLELELIFFYRNEGNLSGKRGETNFWIFFCPTASVT